MPCIRRCVKRPSTPRRTLDVASVAQLFFIRFYVIDQHYSQLTSRARGIIARSTVLPGLFTEVFLFLHRDNRTNSLIDLKTIDLSYLMAVY